MEKFCMHKRTDLRRYCARRESFRVDRCVVRVAKIVEEGLSVRRGSRGQRQACNKVDRDLAQKISAKLDQAFVELKVSLLPSANYEISFCRIELA